jgi:nucleotide-binding universal stress UspA family protein
MTVVKASAAGEAVAGPAAAPARGRIQRILLATDLSPASEGAARQALELAADLGADLLIVSVIDPRALHLPGARFGIRVDQVRMAREAAAQGLVAQGRASGVKVGFLVWEGEPGESVVEAAISERADLVVVGSHGRGSVGRFFIGSVSEHVVRNAPCPVLVVRAPGSTSAAPGT